MLVAWIGDQMDIPGGAELSAREYIENAPDDVKIVRVGNGEPIGVEPDVIFVGNVTMYDPMWVLREAYGCGAPVVKLFSDFWPYRNERLLGVALEMARRSTRVLFRSPQHYSMYCNLNGEVDEDLVSYLPAPVNVAKFEAARRPDEEREGAVWIGSMTSQYKGYYAALCWAHHHGPLDFYGHGDFAPYECCDMVRYHGHVDPDEIPALMGKAKKFVFAPEVFETYGRTIIEAFSAGCELITNGNAGAMWWIDNHPEAIELAVPMFWDVMRESASQA